MNKVTIGLVLVLVLILSACAQTPSQSTTKAQTATISPTLTSSQALTPKSGGILKIVPRMPSKIFGYPGDMVSSSSCDVSTPCLESLCGVNTKGEFMPTELATACELAPDGKSITFTLRKGVKFHDGTDFNANAAKWNLEQTKKARIPGTESWNTVVDVIDDYTIRLNLKTYQNTLMGQLANISRVSSPTAFEKYGVDKIHTYPVGTGPFKFVSYDPDVSIKWERNDEYWGGKPYLDGMETVLIADDMAKSAALQSKGVDILFNVTSETGLALRKNGYNVTTGGQESLACLIPDSTNADSHLSNIKVRQAVEYALDRDALSKLGNGFWTPVYQPATPNTPGYIPDLKGRQYDPVKAKQLLTEAGYPDGFKTSLISATTPGVTPIDTQVAMQQYLSKIGVTIDLQNMTANQRTELNMSGWKNAFLTAGIFCSLNYLSGLNYFLAVGGNLYISAAKPDGYGALWTQATEAMDMTTVIQLSQKIDMMLYEDATVIPLWAAPQMIYAQQPYVHDANLYSTGSSYEWTPEKVWLSK